MPSKFLNSFTFFSIISVIILYAGFSSNVYKAADYRRYYDNGYSFMEDPKTFPEFPYTEIFWTFDRWSESLVLGRLVKSRKDGLLSSGGFLGCLSGKTPAPPDGAAAIMFEQGYQYELYLTESLDKDFNQYHTYRSQTGGQAFLLGILDRMIPGSNLFKLKFYYHLVAALSAMTFFIIIFWFAKEFGLLTGWLLTVSFSLFLYPTLYAKNLFWSLWVFYIPFILFLYILKHEEQEQTLSISTFIITGFLGIFIKMFINGFEFITTTFLMSMIPFFYYGIKNKWPVKMLFTRLMVSAIGLILAALLSFAILSFQFVMAGQKFQDGLNHIQNSFIKRTQTNRSSNPDEAAVEKSSDSSLKGVLKYYATYPAVVDLNNFGSKTVIRNKHVLTLFFLVSMMLICWHKFLIRQPMSSKLKALIMLHFLAVLPPLSWFVIFKQHSVIHKVHDAVVWYMPYMFFGVALCGVFLKDIRKLFSPGMRSGQALVCLAAVLLAACAAAPQSSPFRPSRR